MNVRDHVRALDQRRKTAHAELNALYDGLMDSGRRMTEAERATEKRLNDDIEQFEGEIRRFVEHEERERQGAELRNQTPGLFDENGGMSRWETEDKTNEAIRSFLTSDGPRQMRVPIGAAISDTRHLHASLKWDTTSAGSVVPTHMGRTLYEYLESEVAMLRMPTTKLVTQNGANFDYPKLTTHTIGTQVIAQGTAIGGTDPGFDKVAFSSYKYGALVQVAYEVIEDSAIDVSSFVLRDSGRALGRIIDTAFVLGAGSDEPMGIFTAGATGAAGTVATGGTALAPTYEKLIDLQYSVNDSYRNGGNAAWLFKDSTAATLRKLRDGAGGTVGAPLWQTSTTMGIGAATARQPAELLGDPAYTDSNVAAIGSANKIAAYGDWSAFVLRLVHDVVLERDDSFAFDKDMVTFRAKWRVDSRLLDPTAINILNSNTA